MNTRDFAETGAHLISTQSTGLRNPKSMST